jgi:hypothetical protein
VIFQLCLGVSREIIVKIVECDKQQFEAQLNFYFFSRKCIEDEQP